MAADAEKVTPATCEIATEAGELCGAPAFNRLPTKSGRKVNVCRDCLALIHKRWKERRDQRANDFAGRPRGVRRNDPCPCGSGLKAKKCCSAPE